MDACKDWRPMAKSSFSADCRVSNWSIVQLASDEAFPYSERMEVHFTPEVEKKLNDLATQSGRGTDEVLQDALAVYFDELVQTRDVLNSRYDELKSGRVKAIDGEEVIARLREKSAARRSQPGL